MPRFRVSNEVQGKGEDRDMDKDNAVQAVEENIHVDDENDVDVDFSFDFDESSPSTTVIWQNEHEREHTTKTAAAATTMGKAMAMATVNGRQEPKSILKDKDRALKSKLASTVKGKGNGKGNMRTNDNDDDNGNGDAPIHRVSFGSDVTFRQKVANQVVKKSRPTKTKVKRRLSSSSAASSPLKSSSSRRKISSPLISTSKKRRGDGGGNENRYGIGNKSRIGTGKLSSVSSTSASSSSSTLTQSQSQRTSPQLVSPLPQRQQQHQQQQYASNSNVIPILHNHNHNHLQNYTHNNSNSNSNIHIPPRGVAIDTRILQSFTGDGIGRSFRKECVSFLQSCAGCGLLPSMLGVTKWKEPTSRGGTSSSKRVSRVNHSQCSMEARAIRIPEYLNEGYCNYMMNSASTSTNTSTATRREVNEERKDLFEHTVQVVPIQPPSNMNNTKNRSNVHVPKRLLACDSWRMFGDLIDAMVKERDEKEMEMETAGTTSAATGSGAANANANSAMDVTILTNDVALLTDTNGESHKRALNRLWDRLRPKFEEGKIQKVHIIAFQTGVDGMEPHRRGQHLESNSNSHESGLASGSGSGSSSLGSSGGGDQLLEDIPHKFKVAHCAKIVQNHISTLLSREYKRKTSSSGSGSGSGGSSSIGLETDMDVRFDLKDFHAMHLDTIVREWSKGAVAVTSMSSGAGRIRFDLPETLDGTQCSVTLDLSYAILPYPVHCPATNAMVEDLRDLGRSYFEVVQLAPIDTIDLTLMYGVPMIARAGLEGAELDQFREMQKLVRELWKYLGSQDVALVLRCIHNSDSSTAVASPLHTSYHGNRDKQQSLFILMAQVSSCGKATGNGILYRYVSRGNQILEKSEADFFYEEGKENEYSEVITTSLEFLEKSVVNPFVLESDESALQLRVNNNKSSSVAGVVDDDHYNNGVDENSSPVDEFEENPGEHEDMMESEYPSFDYDP